MARALRPDCADFVYFLRAYFAYKMGLPFGYSNCSRGTGGTPPKCYQWFDIEHPEVTRPAAAARTRHRGERRRGRRRPASAPRPAFGRCLPSRSRPATPVRCRPSRRSRSPKRPADVRANICAPSATSSIPARCASSANDDNTDFYTVPLTQKALRPGTVYADPYGHVLMLVQRVPEVDGTPGVFLAVDAEPDGSVTRKRFWRGNFLFVHEPALGSPGFKRFRPIVREKNGPLRRLTNAEIAQKSAIR